MITNFTLMVIAKWFNFGCKYSFNLLHLLFREFLQIYLTTGGTSHHLSKIGIPYFIISLEELLPQVDFGSESQSHDKREKCNRLRRHFSLMKSDDRMMIFNERKLDLYHKICTDVFLDRSEITTYTTIFDNYHGCIHLLNTRKNFDNICRYCCNTWEYWPNTWKMCSPASAIFEMIVMGLLTCSILASIVTILVSLKAILMYLKACGRSLL